MKKLMTAAAVSIIVLTSACGAGRPSTDDLSAAISEAAGSDVVSDEAADCLADTLIDSDISDDTLNKIVDGDLDVTGVSAVPQDDADAFEAVQDDFAACITG